jgi:hypothetical protein
MMAEIKSKGQQIMDDFKAEKWHPSKRFQVADLLTMLIIAAAFAVYVNGIDGRTKINTEAVADVGVRAEREIAALEAKTAVEIRNLKERDQELRVEMNRHQDQVLTELKEINNKMDRHMEAHNQVN